jgi:O-antigen ligase
VHSVPKEYLSQSIMYNLILFLAVYLPFQIALNPTEGIDLASIRVLILIIFLLWLAESLKNKKLIIKKNIQTGLIISFLFLNLVSVMVAKNTDWSVRKLLFLFSIFPLYFVATIVISNKGRMIKISRLLVFSGAAVSFIGIAQFFSQFIFGLEKVFKFWANNITIPFLGKTFSQAVLQNPSWLVNISGKTYLRATATFPDPHMLSFFLGLIIPIALALLLLEKRKILYGFLFVALLFGDALTFSRGGYLGVFAGILAAIIIFWHRIKKNHRSYLIALTGIFILTLAIPNPVSKRYFSSFDLKEGSNKGRIETWKQALEIVANHPITGVGIGNYPLEIKSTATYREPIYAHNTYLDIAAETGILNALVWIGLLISVIISFIKKSKDSIIFPAFAIGLVIFSAHSLVETAIYSPVILTLLLLIISFNGLDKQNEEIS